jgi:hypothetical protein
MCVQKVVSNELDLFMGPTGDIRKMDRFRSKLVSFLLLVFLNGMYNHESLLLNP